MFNPVTLTEFHQSAKNSIFPLQLQRSVILIFWLGRHRDDFVDSCRVSCRVYDCAAAQLRADSVPIL